MLLRLRILLPTRYWLLLAFAIIGITGGYEPAHSAVLTVWATPAIPQSYQNTDAGARAIFVGVGTQSITLGSAPNTPPGAGTQPLKLQSLWAWDVNSSGWYFWAPSLVNNATLASYLTAKGYLDFATIPSTPEGRLSPSTGVWVNVP